MSGRPSSRVATLQQSLSRHGLLPVDIAVDLKPLQGGYHNYVYRLRAAENIDWVVKQFVSNVHNPMYPILPDSEAAALEALRGKDIAPEFVAYLPQAAGGEILVYEFIKGDSWCDDLPAMAGLLGRLHRLPPPDGFRLLPTSPTDLIDDTLDTLRQMQNADPAIERLKAFMTLSDAGPADRVTLIHTDCGPGNVIVGEHGPRIIDWQCPGIGDPAEDLANFSSPAIQMLYGKPVLSEAHRELFLESYPDDEIVARYQRIGRYHHLRIAAYCSYRIEALRQSQSEVSALYERALEAEISHLQRLV